MIRGVQVMYAREQPNGIQNHPASGLETNVFHGARQNAVTTRRHSLSRFQARTATTTAKGEDEGPLRDFETNEISGVKDTSFLHSFFGAASLLKRSTCREGHSSRLVAFRNLPKEISSVGDAERSRGQNIISAFRTFSDACLVSTWPLQWLSRGHHFHNTWSKISKRALEKISGTLSFFF